MKKNIIGVNYLHSHSQTEKVLGVDPKHVIIDRNDWDEVVNFFRTHSAATEELRKFQSHKPKKIIIEDDLMTSYHDAIQFLTNEINKELPTETTIIIGNSQIMSVLMDSDAFYAIPNSNGDITPIGVNYTIGKYHNSIKNMDVDLIVDPNMSWGDMRLFFMKDGIIFDEIEIVDDGMILI